MQENLLDKKRKFKCQRCGACCKLVGLSVYPEIRGMAQENSGACRYLTSDNLCSIYKKRPIFCRVDRLYDLVIKNSGITREEWHIMNTNACTDMRNLLINKTNNMKAEDLMKGFIVNTPNGIGNVVQIFDNGASVEVDGRRNNYFFSELSFAGITKEILEKNGLRQIVVKGDNGEQEYFVYPMVGYYNLTSEQRLHRSSCVYTPSKDNTYGWLCINTDKGRIEVACDYVHQFQYALKLCGIEKEIVL